MIRPVVALLLLLSGASACAADPVALIRSAVERCRVEQAMQPARIGPAKEGGFWKQQELGAKYAIQVAPASSNEPLRASVEIATTITRVTGASEEAVRAMPISLDVGVAGLERRYIFESKDGHWLLVDAYLRPIMKMPPGLTAQTIGAAKISPDAARGGSDAGPTCIHTIEAL